MEGVLQVPIGFCADSSHFEIHALLYLPLVCVVLVPQENFLLNLVNLFTHYHSFIFWGELLISLLLSTISVAFCGSLFEPPAKTFVQDGPSSIVFDILELEESKSKVDSKLPFLMPGMYEVTFHELRAAIF